MHDKQPPQLLLAIDITQQPLSNSDLDARRQRLKILHRTYLSAILGIFVLGAVVSYRAISLGFDTDELELFKMSLYIGM